MTFQLPRDSLIIFPFSLSELVDNKHCTTAADRGGAGSIKTFVVTLFSEMSSRLEQFSVGVVGGQGVLIVIKKIDFYVFDS